MESIFNYTKDVNGKYNIKDKEDKEWKDFECPYHDYESFDDEYYSLLEHFIKCICDNNEKKLKIFNVLYEDDICGRFYTEEVNGWTFRLVFELELWNTLTNENNYYLFDNEVNTSSAVACYFNEFMEDVIKEDEYSSDSDDDDNDDGSDDDTDDE